MVKKASVQRAAMIHVRAQQKATAKGLKPKGSGQRVTKLKVRKLRVRA